MNKTKMCQDLKSTSTFVISNVDDENMKGLKGNQKISCKISTSLLSQVIFLSSSSSLIKEVSEMILKTTSTIHGKTSNDISTRSEYNKSNIELTYCI